MFILVIYWLVEAFLQDIFPTEEARQVFRKVMTDDTPHLFMY